MMMHGLANVKFTRFPLNKAHKRISEVTGRVKPASDGLKKKRQT